MASTTLLTRIQNKSDLYQNWTDNNPTPLKGEICIVEIPAATGAVVQEPAILFKAGDGENSFNDLPFCAALAADVHNWAKSASKPVYTADEITGLAGFIAGEIEDTNTLYKLEQDETDGHIIKLFSKEITDADWTLVTTITTVDTVYDDTALIERIANLETAMHSAGHLKREIVDDLPEAEDADPDTIYMVKDESVTTGDAYREYMLISGEMTQIGDTTVNLEPYVKSADLAAVATSGDAKDLTQTAGDYIILNCGTSSTII